MRFCVCVPAPPVVPSGAAIDDDAQEGGDQSWAEEEKDLSVSTLQPSEVDRRVATSPQQLVPEPEPEPCLELETSDRVLDDMAARLTEAEIRIENRLQAIADRVAEENEHHEVDAVLASSRRAIELLAALQAEEATGPAPTPPVALRPTKSTEDQLFAHAEALSVHEVACNTRKFEPVLESGPRRLVATALAYPQTKPLTPDSRARYQGGLQRAGAVQEFYACRHWAYCKFSGRYEELIAHEQWCGY